MRQTLRSTAAAVLAVGVFALGACADPVNATNSFPIAAT